MHRRHFLASPLAALPLRAARRPNILILLADDLGFADLGFQGSNEIPTPHLDTLARTGVRFTNGYVSHPFCSPTRAGLMTGRYQQRFGHENNPRYDPRDEVSGLPTDQITLAQLLKDAGYATGLFGKWHLGAAPRFHPMKRGFTETFSFLGGGHDYFETQLDGEPREYLIPIQRNGNPVALNEYLTDALSREAAAFIGRRREHPFLLYLAYNTPHTPLQPASKYLDRFAHIANERRRKYAAMVSALDDGVGRVLGALREAKLESDTLVFFLSDNGGPPEANASSNHPLRASKGTVYEGGIRVPFVARWPGVLEPGLYHHPVISLDLLPTALGAAGLKPPAVDGVDLLPHLTDKSPPPPHEKLFWRTGGGVSGAVRQGRFKLVRPPGGGPPQLFDLETDAGESNDLAAARSVLAVQLNAAWEQWNRQLVPPLF
ncbi:MAG: sulfatase [Acidobacteria bacterium]|nr:sulfatase [Acidobacteriota bacterium]